MPRHVALLRAINVGGHTVTMARLRELFLALGFEEVSTVIASGNVLFDSRARPATLEPRIEAHLEQALGYPVATFLRSPQELEAAAAHSPGPSGASVYIGFTRGEPGAAAGRALRGLETAVDAFHLEGREVYWVCRTSMGQSAISSNMVERAVGMPLTFRNITTVRRLADKSRGTD